MFEEKNGYMVEKTELENGKIRVTLEFYPTEKINGNKCVSRTVTGGNLATYTRAEIVMDDNGNMSIAKEDSETSVKSPTVEGAKAELERMLGGTIVVHSVEKIECGVFGLPRELFNMLARPASRPESQLASKSTVGGAE